LNSPRWTDYELLSELGGALEEPPLDENIIRAAQAAFTWRTVDAELEILSLDAGLEHAGAAQVRGTGPGSPRIFAFHGGRLSVELEIDDAGIVGQLTPPEPGQVTLMTPDGQQATAQTDEIGCFTLPPPPPGPIRLDCRVGTGHVVTEWMTVPDFVPPDAPASAPSPAAPSPAPDENSQQTPKG
jgi:hypothetical protein